MKKDYIKIPLYTTFNEIVDNNFSLSSSQYKSLRTNNTNLLNVSDFLDRELKRSDYGKEVGSENYLNDTGYYFIKTKALQEESFLINETKEAIESINPHSFIRMNLKKGDLLISKDSNVGEIIILDKDYPKHMLCSGIYKLPITKNKYYLLAFIKSDLVRQQLDFMVPRGSTIRHGKTKFLDCKIPMPNSNKEETIKYVEVLTQAIINKEIEINNKYKRVSKIVKEELLSNQKSNIFNYSQPTMMDIVENNRMDSKIYSKTFKEIDFILKNYTNGVFYIEEKDIKGGNTPKKRFIAEDNSLKYFWVTPTLFSDIGILNNINTINCKKNNINKNCLLIVNRTSKGEDGEYVGMSYFYDYELLGKGQHNQGLYRIENFSKNKLIFINALLNSEYYRTYCGQLSMGSKMKEIKINEIRRIPFPNFPDDKEKEVVKLYHNLSSIYNPEKCSLEDFLTYDNEFNKEAGIYEIDKSKRILKENLDKAIENIINDIEVKVNFNIKA